MTTIVGVAGTAKNTGKTTTTSALINEAMSQGLNIGLTSIGYDGEEVDNITGLPKPRLTLKKGAIMATAKKCLVSGTAKFEVLSATDIITPLGRIYIVKILEEGLVIIAGPNKSNELRRVLEMMRELAGCQLIIVDGALNRIAPMVETDGIILATGASRNTDIDALVEETKALNEIFNLQQVDEDEKAFFSVFRNIILAQDNAVAKTLKYGFLIDKKSVEQIAKGPQEYDTVFIPALVTEATLKELNDAMEENWKNKTLVIKDPTRLAVGGTPEEMIRQVNRIVEFGGSVKILMKLPLLAITVNPFYPRYRFNSNVYEAHHVDQEELKQKMKAEISIPVTDIKEDGTRELMNILTCCKRIEQ